MLTIAVLQMSNPKSERRLFYLLIAYTFVCFNLLRHFTSDSASFSDEHLLKAYRSKSDWSNHFISTFNGDVNLKVINDKVYAKFGYQIVEITRPLATLRLKKQPTCGSNLNFSWIPTQLQLSMFNFSSVAAPREHDESLENCDKGMRNALESQSFNDHDGLIVGRGSEEVMGCLGLGVNRVLNIPTARNPLNLTKNFHFVVFSAFLDPIYDLQEVQNIKCVMRTGGLLFVSVHIGLDHVFVDSHRIYGTLRMPMLLVGFKLIKVFVESGEVELNENMLGGHEENLRVYVLVLRKR